MLMDGLLQLVQIRELVVINVALITSATAAAIQEDKFDSQLLEMEWLIFSKITGHIKGISLIFGGLLTVTPAKYMMGSMVWIIL